MLTIKNGSLRSYSEVFIDGEISGDLTRNVLDAVMRKDESRSTRFM